MLTQVKIRKEIIFFPIKFFADGQVSEHGTNITSQHERTRENNYPQNS